MKIISLFWKSDITAQCTNKHKAAKLMLDFLLCSVYQREHVLCYSSPRALEFRFTSFISDSGNRAGSRRTKEAEADTPEVTGALGSEKLQSV